MIRMNYGDPAHQTALEKTFIGLLDNEVARQEEWTKLRKRLYGLDADFKKLLPTQLKEMMKKPYVELAEIYEKYVRLSLKKDDNLHLKLKDLFSYEKMENGRFHALRDSIISFFKDEKNGFEIHICHYCDITYINCFQYGKKNVRTQFDLDHVLDKGRCPLVALSLYNLVLACPTCNGPHIKGRRVMPVSLVQRQKLSPSSSLYDFDRNVKIWIRPITGKTHNINFLKYMDDYELDFDTSADPDYKEEIDFFYLKQRYNYHKCEALRLADLKAKYTSSRIEEMAKIICSLGKGEKYEKTLAAYSMIEQIKTDLFGSKFSDEHHRAFGKLRKDILGF